jgi:hypothetical protein
MAKPILVIKAPLLTREQQRNFFESTEQLRKRMTDYYIIALPGEGDGYSVQVFYEKDMAETTLEGLQEYIKANLNR